MILKSTMILWTIINIKDKPDVSLTYYAWDIVFDIVSLTNSDLSLILMVVLKIMVDFKMMVLVNIKDPQWHPFKIITIKGQPSQAVAHIELSFIQLLTHRLVEYYPNNTPQGGE